MPCTFCAIVAGEVDAVVVAETDLTLAFLDHRPLFEGHTLLIPKPHVETLRDLPDPMVEPYFTELRRVAVGVQDGLGADGTFVAENNVVSQSVPHLHFHVVPRRRKDGLRGFFWPRGKYEGGRDGEVAALIRAALPPDDRPVDRAG